MFYIHLAQIFHKSTCRKKHLIDSSFLYGFDSWLATLKLRIYMHNVAIKILCRNKLCNGLIASHSCMSDAAEYPEIDIWNCMEKLASGGCISFAYSKELKLLAYSYKFECLHL